MSQLLDMVGGYLNDDNVARMSQSIGADQEQTQKAISAALPTLLGAITRNASNSEGQQQLLQALSRDHNGSLLDHLGSFFGPGANPTDQPGLTNKTTSGGAILDHILGNRKERVETGVSKVSGLSSGQSTQLMSMLAPLLMGALGKKTQQDNLSADGLGSMLQGEKEQVESSGFAGGLISRMLDQDGDGDFDMMDIVKVGFGRFFKRS